MTQQELVERMTDWLADYAKRVRQRKNDLPEAEAWSFRDHVLIPAGCVMLDEEKTSNIMWDGEPVRLSGLQQAAGFCRVLPLAPEREGKS